MSSKKIDKNAPFSSTLTTDDKKRYNYPLVQSQDGMWYVFPNEATTVAIINPRQVLKDWATFSAEMESKPNDLHDLFVTAFNREPTKGEMKDKVELSIQVWMQLSKTAANRLNSAPDPKTLNEKGEVKRVFKKLMNRGYEVIKLEVDPALKLPPQARTCLEFFSELVKTENPSGEDRIVTISEKVVQTYVETNAERLKTRQDPWRIFQYYRPTLIKDGFIRLV
ncbi:hypothetical protein UFOVP1090_2 [uncultured Caudovirales phage]|uniref:Uncharacterized protein n=1 Tax=uncultured Caudovirales phage TaxID=2100421 RepID=A0A6J5QS69_9CAUD|nr:hypothetical protein UFOVP1090_2 [uncultured Caudovirales phage]